MGFELLSVREKQVCLALYFSGMNSVGFRGGVHTCINSGTEGRQRGEGE